MFSLSIGGTMPCALTSAILEAYEHAAAENVHPPVRMAEAQEAMRNAQFADPAILPTDRRIPLRAVGSPIRWVEFEKLISGGSIWIPYDLERPKARSWSDLPQGPRNNAVALAWLLDRLCSSGFPDATAFKLDQREGAVAVRVVEFPAFMPHWHLYKGWKW